MVLMPEGLEKCIDCGKFTFPHERNEGRCRYCERELECGSLRVSSSYRGSVLKK